MFVKERVTSTLSANTPPAGVTVGMSGLLFTPAKLSIV